MTWITIFYGQQESIILNSDCQVEVFLACIRRLCKIKDNALNVDLSDQNGTLQFVSNMAPNSRVSDKLTSRSKYILVKVLYEDGKVIVTPLLCNWVPSRMKIAQ